jgi:hypothetical protein
MSVFRNSDGTYASGGPDITIPLALAKAKLSRILTTTCDGRGRIPDGAGDYFSNEDQVWAMKVVRQRPEWAEQTLRNAGCKE